MRNSSLLKLLIYLLIPAATLIAAPSLTDSAVYDNSALWPQRAALTADFDTIDSDASRTIPSGREAVLIRLEPGEPIHALLDFGRLGLHSVPLAQTDVLTRAEKIKNGDEEKEIPNWTMMIGRGFSKLNHGTGQGGSSVPLSDLEGIKRFLIVYLDSDVEAMQATGELLDQYAEIFEANSILPVIFGIGRFPTIGEAPYMRTLRENGLEPYIFIVPHVSAPYARSMAHGISKGPGIILVDTEGKTLSNPISTTTSISEKFAKLEAYLKASGMVDG